MAEERLRLLVKVSSMYYLEGMNQQDIALKLGISRPQISRMLGAAKSEGIVQITIKNPFSEEQQVEKELIDVFGLQDALVVHMPGADRQLLDAQLARAGAVLLENVLKDRDVVGVMAGKSVAATGAELQFSIQKHLQIVPLVGGWGATGTAWHANANAKTIGEKLKSAYWQLNAPAIVASEQAREVFLQEVEIAKVLALAAKASTALVGIGQVSKEATIVQSGHMGMKELDELRSIGAVANICTAFINERGEAVPHSSEGRMIGLDANALKVIPNVVAVAGGEDKVIAIAAALRGKWASTIVTDMFTAQQVLEWHRDHPL
ncbi:sugar-binding transcriptional regulator [Paenibacillus hexagrammi]|uniref:Sugar-binding transcriptional regulator n=1 Tax=Paenibacillus hexagrammi TaxID=2908839 RepID=A0ABY3SBF8_9BACL|nr:sugar-binding domain-containing protein [Paenibacillus sp. YPD9-1]UJF31308.1 sugar-binding transcriptional regulator [Paenibacillus sp. YPD9-1]